MTDATPPPSDTDAEASVLRAWLSDSEFRMAWEPEPDLFFGHLHQTIADMMLKHAGAKRFGEQALLAALRRAQLLQGRTATEQVLHAVSGPVVTDPWADIERLRELAAMRNLQYDLDKAQAAITPGARLHDVQGLLRAADTAAVESVGLRLISARDLSHEVLEHINSHRPIQYCTTCYERIDRATGGIRPGDAWVLRADTSWGKSSWGGVAVPDENIDRGKRVAVITLEDPPGIYGRRIACRRARVSYSAMRDRRLNPLQKANVTRVLAELEKQTLWVLPAVGQSIERICGCVRSAIRIHGLHLVVLDYAQKLRTETRTESRERALVYCAEKFADICKTDGVPSLLLSQMTVNDKGENKTKGAGAIKDMAETLLEGRCENRAGVTTKTIRCVKVKEGKAGGEFETKWDDVSASFVADVPRELGLPTTDEEYDND